MEEIAIIVITIIVAFIIAFYADRLRKQKNTNQQQVNQVPQTQKPVTYEDLPYKKRQLLTKTEYIFYNTLRKKCDETHLLICPKVRFEDFIEVTEKEYRKLQKFRGYIKSRHIDFLICDSKLNILAGLELDDKSHNTKKAIQTDNFKNNVFRKIGIPLFRIKTSQNYKSEIQHIINNLGINRNNIDKNNIIKSEGFQQNN